MTEAERLAAEHGPEDGDEDEDEDEDEGENVDAMKAAIKAALAALAAYKGKLPKDTLSVLAEATGLEVPVREVEVEKVIVRQAAPGIPAEPVYRAGTRDFDLSGVEEGKRDVACAVWTARAEAKAAHEAVALVRRERARERMVTRAEALRNVPGAPTEKIADLLLHASERLDKPSFELLLAVLDGAEAVIRKSAALRVVGRGAAPGDGSAYAAIRAKAKALVDSGKAPTIEQAENAVYLTPEGAELYEQMRAEQGDAQRAR